MNFSWKFHPFFKLNLSEVGSSLRMHSNSPFHGRFGSKCFLDEKKEEKNFESGGSGRENSHHLPKKMNTANKLWNDFYSKAVWAVPKLLRKYKNDAFEAKLNYSFICWVNPPFFVRFHLQVFCDFVPSFHLFVGTLHCWRLDFGWHIRLRERIWSRDKPVRREKIHKSNFINSPGMCRHLWTKHVLCFCMLGVFTPVFFRLCFSFYLYHFQNIYFFAFQEY